MTERELARGAARRLAIIRHAQEVTGNVALTCRYYGITRQCYYVWFRRYEEFGVEGLRDRSSRPHLSPRTTREEVVGKIIYLRQYGSGTWSRAVQQGNHYSLGGGVQFASKIGINLSIDSRYGTSSCQVLWNFFQG